MPSYEGSDGTTLHYDVVGGDSEPTILLAGGAARHPSYLGDLAGLSESHQLIVPHLRGVGRSPMPVVEARGSYWSQADDIERLRIHLGLDRVVVVAHSAGTRLAIAYAAQFTKSLARTMPVTKRGSSKPRPQAMRIGARGNKPTPTSVAGIWPRRKRISASARQLTLPCG